MSWFTPEVIDVILQVVKSVVIFTGSGGVWRIYELCRASFARLIPKPLRA